MQQASIMVHQQGPVAWVRIEGQGSFKNARHIKSFAEKMLEHGVNEFVFDLKTCTYMDSTFMGILAGIASNLKKHQAPPPVVANATPRNLELLQNLGLDRLLKIENRQLEWEDFATISTSGDTKQNISKTMLEAHEALIQADARNSAKFQDVLTYLREKLGVQDV